MDYEFVSWLSWTQQSSEGLLVAARVGAFSRKDEDNNAVIVGMENGRSGYQITSSCKVNIVLGRET